MASTTWEKLYVSVQYILYTLIVSYLTGATTMQQMWTANMDCPPVIWPHSPRFAANQNIIPMQAPDSTEDLAALGWRLGPPIAKKR